MDDNLEDSLNLESAIGEMDFEQAGDVVVSQADITLDAGTQDGDMTMEFDHIEEQQPILMDTGYEEIIVSDFMSDQFSLQEYSVQDDQTTTATTTEESNQQSVLTSQAEPLLHFDSQTVAPIKQEAAMQPKYIAIKAALRGSTPKKAESPGGRRGPRQVAIAPKPGGLAGAIGAGVKPLPIAPKPVALVANSGLVKKLPLSGVIQAGAKGNTVLAQIGKQLVMMPSGKQNIKLVTCSGSTTMPNIQYIKANAGQAQLIPTKSLQGTKPIKAKVIVQGQPNTDLGNQQTIITKILPSTSSAPPQARYVMQQKTVPISLGNKVLLASPTSQGIKFTKKQQIIAIKSPTPKLMPAPALASNTKKVVISANPSQNVILKTTAPPKAAQLNKDGKVVVQGQKTQFHQINVPGKGIQYIRLITNQTPNTTKTVTKPQTSSVNVPSKAFLLTDSKGNLIQMSAEKVISGQPPPLVFTGNQPAANKWQQKFVRIAAAPPKTSTIIPATSRSSQSLLAPLSPINNSAKPEDVSTVQGSAAEEVAEEETEMDETDEADEEYAQLKAIDAADEEPTDSKAALHALIADAVRGGDHVRKIELEYSPLQSPKQNENTDSMEPHESTENLEEQLIVIPSTYLKTDITVEEDYNQAQNEVDRLNMINIEPETDNSYLTPRSPLNVSDCDVITTELGLRPRRACNCTKSQCLKLYCDCFANGEFCNQCNCNNCYNNLNYEELRQKAIRACLERNPNAFRPKIGKSKTGGPEIIRRHNKGCNCKRSGCLKNYCECYEAKIACTSMCKCFGCRNVEETLHRARRRDRDARPSRAPDPLYRPPPPLDLKQPCSFMTAEVIEAVCQCLIAAGVDGGAEPAPDAEPDPVRDVIDEFSRCLQDIISASHHAAPLSMLDEGHT